MFITQCPSQGFDYALQRFVVPHVKDTLFLLAYLHLREVHVLFTLGFVKHGKDNFLIPYAHE
jgi:hypothetical protein